MGFVNQSEPLWQEIAGIVADEGLRLYDLEQAHRSALKVTIATDAATGVTSGDCSRVCRRLMVFCQAEGARLGVGAEPEIDVSSPGLDRSLRLPEHFRSAVGKTVKCVPTSDQPWAEVQGKRLVGVLRGLLEAFEEGALHVREERTQERIVAPLSSVKRANVELSAEDLRPQPPASAER